MISNNMKFYFKNSCKKVVQEIDHDVCMYTCISVCKEYFVKEVELGLKLEKYGGLDEWEDNSV